MLQWALTDLLDEQACYNYLLQALHPKGLHCPAGHCLPVNQPPHNRQGFGQGCVISCDFFVA